MSMIPSLPDIDPPPPEDASRCQLLGPTALIVQGLMGIFVIASLILKRHFETHKRPWKIWIWDVGKQLVGQTVLHGLNLLISGLLSIDHNNNPCSAYLLNILIDTTIGVLIIYFALKHATWFFSVYLGKEGYESGQYGHPPQAIFWWRQLAPYLISVFIMKLVVLLPLTLPGISTILLRVGHAAIEYLSPSVQVVFVMMIFPLIMNVVQFCLIDQVIKGPKDGQRDAGGSGQYGLARDVEDTPHSPLLPPDQSDRHGLYGRDADVEEEREERRFALGRESTSIEMQRSVGKHVSAKEDDR